MLNIMSKKKNLLRSGFSLSILTMGSRILGLIREMTKATFLGTSDLADAFTFAFQLPNLFRRLFAENAISVAFIPTFRNKLEEETAKNPDLDYSQLIETRQFLNSTLTVVTFLTTLVSALGMILIPFIAPFFTKSSDPIFLGEMSTLTRIMFPYLIFISVAAFFQGILNGVNIFSPSGFTPILFNLIVITCTYAFAGKTANPARAMAYGVIFGGVVQAAFQLPFVLKQGFRFSLTGLKKAFTNPNTKTVMRLIVPTLFGMAAYQLNDLVSMAVAGNAGSGIQSSLQYSLRLQELILGIFAVTIGTIILPDLTSYAKNKDFTQFNGLLKNAIRIIAFITIPITFFAFVTGENIIRLVFQNKSFSEESVALVKQAFQYHIVGLFFIALNRILSPAFYAQSNTKSPTIAGIIGFGANIILAIALAPAFKGGGIAFALSFSSAINTVFLFIFMKKGENTQTGDVVKTTIFYSLKMIVLSIIAIIPVILLKEWIFGLFANYNRLISQGLPLIILILIFGIIGVLLMIITKDSLVKTIVSIVKNRGRKTKVSPEKPQETNQEEKQ